MATTTYQGVTFRVFYCVRVNGRIVCSTEDERLARQVAAERGGTVVERWL